MLSWSKFPSKSSRGGIRYGLSYWDAANYTWPFAVLKFAVNGLQITIDTIISRKILYIDAKYIVQIKKGRGFPSSEYQIVHCQVDLLETIIFFPVCDKYFDRKLALWKHFVMDNVRKSNKLPEVK